jgi:hypothetical protein
VRPQDYYLKQLERHPFPFPLPTCPSIDFWEQQVAAFCLLGNSVLKVMTPIKTFKNANIVVDTNQFGSSVEQLIFGLLNIYRSLNNISPHQYKLRCCCC